MKRGLVFAGQGVQRKGMCMQLTQCSRRAAQLWERVKCCMMDNYGIAIQEVVQANPKRIAVHRDALDVAAIAARACRGPSLARPESHPRPTVVSHAGGVMQYSYLTQPCVLAAQMIALEAMREAYALGEDLHEFAAVAGHSLGEYTALCALGVFDVETALHLTYRRGLLMEEAVASARRGTLCMYACNPSRAMLSADADKADDAFFVLVELIARSLRRTDSFLEAVNFNLYHEQYIVAGDVVAMAVLGKCLDPQFRATHSATGGGAAQHLVQAALIDAGIDKQSGLLTVDVNCDKVDEYVSSGRRYGVRHAFRRFMRGPDDGHTPALDELTHLTLEGDGRSGLRRKSWFVPLAVEVPFHSSRLRRSADAFLPMVRDALPDEAQLRALLGVGGEDGNGRPRWVTNLTGTTFAPLSAEWQASALETMGAPNIGEQTHRGCYSSTLMQTTFTEAAAKGSVRDMCAVVLAAQLCHPVLWIEVMDEMVLRRGCTSVVEVSPVRVLSDFFRRSSFVADGCEDGRAVDVHAQCYPADPIFHW